jgi:hypothetical protein
MEDPLAVGQQALPHNEQLITEGAGDKPPSVPDQANAAPVARRAATLPESRHERGLPPPNPKNAAIFERSWLVCAALGTGVCFRITPRST